MNYKDNNYRNKTYYRNSRNSKSVRLRKRRIRRRIKIAAGIIKFLLILVAIGTACSMMYNRIVHRQGEDKYADNQYTSEGLGKGNEDEKSIDKIAGDGNEEAQEKENSTLEVSGLIDNMESMYNEIFMHTGQYPDELLESLEKNPELLDFVYNYPKNKNKQFNIDISGEVNSNKVPLFIQWDERWGYSSYGDSIIAVSGCGPTCLSMVAAYILHDNKMNPKWMAEFSEDNGYVTQNGATMWALMNEGARMLGMESTVIPLDENKIFNTLKEGKPIICSVGPGDFTTEGHFIVMTGVKDGKIVVNDPNSRVRSEKLWEFSDIKGQIKNLWAFRKK